MTHRWTVAAILGFACALATGCADETSRTTAKPPAPTPFDTAAAKAAQATKAADEAAKETVAEPSKATATTPTISYEAPFPDRTDLFEPRKQAARVARLNSGDSAESVVLMGFAKLDEPRVVLAINGEVKPLRSGEESMGIQVISIEPPRAVLQRGRSRWTASIE